MLRLKKRRWFQFGFGTLLVLVAVCGLWFARIAHFARQQREAIQLVKSLGGTVGFDDAYDEASEQATPEWLQEWLGREYFRRIRGVAVVSEDFTDDDLAILAALGDLKVLRFHSSRVTDEGISKLRACEGLEALEIRWARITDAAMADIGAFRNLNELAIYNTRITDVGIRHLNDLPQLSVLMVGNFAPIDAQTLPMTAQQERYSAPITDAALKSIGKIPSLTALSMLWCRETSAGLATFSELRPNVKTFGSGHAYTPHVPPGYSYR